MTLAVVFMFGAAVLFWAVPEFVIGLYIDVRAPANLDVVRHAVVLLGIAAVFQVFDGVQVAAAGALRGLKDTRAPMVIGFLSYWVIGLSSGLVLSFGLGWGAPGLWWGLVLGLGAAALLLAIRFRRSTRRLRAAAGDSASFGTGLDTPLPVEESGRAA
jgi:MATE family multidrug resistance protein